MLEELGACLYLGTRYQECCAWSFFTSKHSHRLWWLKFNILHSLKMHGKTSNYYVFKWFLIICYSDLLKGMRNSSTHSENIRIICLVITGKVTCALDTRKVGLCGGARVSSWYIQCFVILNQRSLLLALLVYTHLPGIKQLRYGPAIYSM